MSTIITHALVAGITGKNFTGIKSPLRFWILAILYSILPDVDVIGFSLGIRYGDFLGHRGFFHSIFFAFFLSIVCGFLFFKKEKLFLPIWNKYVLILFIIGASHGILDTLTDGGLGITLFSPFDTTRYFFPITPIMVSPIGIKSFFSNWGFHVMISEVLYIWLPLLIFFTVFKIVKYKYNEKNYK